MKIIIIAAMLTVLGIYIYFRRANRIFRLDSHGRRSGFDRRKSSIASKNKCGEPTKRADNLQAGEKSPGTHMMRGDAMEWKTDSLTVSVEDRGNFIQITKPGIFDSSCKISFRPEQVDILNHWLMEARSKALELQESAINMVKSIY